nr:MAG TPA: hypothetical protein [Caudoviricetes sp.]
MTYKTINSLTVKSSGFNVITSLRGECNTKAKT